MTFALSPGTGASATPERQFPFARRALILLLCINLFNYIDRNVLAAVVPWIKDAFFDPNGSVNGSPALTGMLRWSQQHLGFKPENALIGILGTAFMVVYTLGAPVFGRLAERYSPGVSISIPYTIAADGEKYMVEIQKNTLTAKFEYQCVPKLDPDAFLIARVTGWEDLNLLSGPMNLFFEGSYVGKSNLDMQNTQDTLELSLGRDKNIVIKRERRREFTALQVIGANRKESRAFDISIRNNKKQDVDMVLMDQLPVSANKDITIDATELSGALIDKDSGKLTWKFLLKPSESRTFRLAYEVKYPKDKKVILE